MSAPRVNVVLFQPDLPRFSILNSYQEVIDSLVWGLQACGFQTSFLRNAFDPQAINIVFGWIPAFQLGGGERFPPNTILYNLEQFSVGGMRGAPILEAAAAGFQIWEYSAANMPRWAELSPRFPVFHAPVSYAPTLERLPAGLPEDIGMLYVGSLGAKRSEKLHVTVDTPLVSNGLVSLTNVWGNMRDEFISRAQLMLNVSNDNPLMKIYEVVRVSYYIANRKAVLSELVPDNFVEEDLRGVLQFCPPAELGQAAAALLAEPAHRRRYADECYEVFRQRDVRDVVRAYFG
jgi:hypothetical protein